MSDMDGRGHIINGKRFAVTMVIDVSCSMADELGALTEGFNDFIDCAKEDDCVKNTMDIAVLTFGSDVKDEFGGFIGIEDVHHMTFATRGSTNMTDALKMAYQMTRERTIRYAESGIEAYRPWIMLMSDGVPDDEGGVRDIGQTLREREMAGKLHVFALGMGTEYGSDILQAVSSRCFAINDWNITEFFRWLGKSMAKVSRSQPGAPDAIYDTGEEWHDMSDQFFRTA